MVNRAMIWIILRHYVIPQKIVNIVRNLYEDTSCRVINNADLSGLFTVNTGVRQGCILSPLIFSLVIDWVMKTMMRQPRGIQWTFTQKFENHNFADDINLLSHTQGHLQAKAENLLDVAKAAGLEINHTKIKSLRLNSSHEASSTIDGQVMSKLINSLPG